MRPHSPARSARSLVFVFAGAVVASGAWAARPSAHRQLPADIASQPDAPPSPILGPVLAEGPLGGTIPSAVPQARRAADPAANVEVTGKLRTSPPLGPPGTTGGTLPSAMPGWEPGH